MHFEPARAAALPLFSGGTGIARDAAGSGRITNRASSGDHCTGTGIPDPPETEKVDCASKSDSFSARKLAICEACQVTGTAAVTAMSAAIWNLESATIFI